MSKGEIGLYFLVLEELILLGSKSLSELFWCRYWLSFTTGVGDSSLVTMIWMIIVKSIKDSMTSMQYIFQVFKP